MSLAYTAPTWENGSGTGISASQLQALSDCMEGLVQGSDKAIHNISINNGVMTVTYADGTIETDIPANMKGISTIVKTGTSGNVDTYTITYSDGTTSTFTVTNGTPPTITITATADDTSSDNPTVTVTKSGTDAAPTYAMAFSGLKGAQGVQGEQGLTGQDGVSPEITITSITGGHRVNITDAEHPSGQTFDVMDGTGSGDMQASVYDPNSTVANAGGIPDYVSDRYSTADTAETTLADDDKIPFYDDSASAKRNSTWSNIKAKLKSYFDPMYKCLVVSTSSVSSLPVTINDSAITSTMVCVKAELSNPSAQTADWTVTTSSGSASVGASGQISGTTDIKLYLVEQA